MGRTWTLERAIESVRNETGDAVKLLSLEKVGRRLHFKLKCACGNAFHAQPNVFIGGKHSCNTCTGKPRYSIEDIASQVADVGDSILLSTKYINSKSHLLFMCNCGDQFTTTMKTFRNGKTTCDQCTNKAMSMRFTKSQEAFVEQVFSAIGGEYAVVGEYRGVEEKVEILHSTCGNVWLANPNDLIFKSSGCPKCITSKGESEITRWLSSAGVPFRTQYRIDACRNIRPLPFDFAIFDDGKLVLLIEYDGIQHFKEGHFTSGTLERTRHTDRIKDDYCYTSGVPLLRIPYYEFKNIPKILHAALCRYPEINKTIPSQAG